MDIGFLWDEEKYRQVMTAHQVKFSEVVSAFEDEDGYELPDPAGHGERWMWIGATVYTVSLQPLMQKESGAMSTDSTFDYQAYMRRTVPEVGHIQRGLQARQQRWSTAKRTITLQIDTDILERLQQMAPENYQHVLNQALREWLTAQDVKDLVREELQAMTAQVVASIRDLSPSP